MITGEFILLFIITLLNIVLWIVFFVRLKRNLSPQRILTDIKNEVEKLLIEINRTVAEDITLIDDRSNKLRELIDECEKKIALYYAQEKSKGRETEVLQRLSPTNKVPIKEKNVAKKYQKNATPVATNVESESVQLSIDFETYRVNERARIIEQKNVPEEKSTPQINQIEENPLPEMPFKNKVLQLAANDFSAETIAQKLGCTETEVQIIIDLYTTL